MNTTTMRENWKAIKGKLKQKYPQLTDVDLVYLEGGEAELIGRIQEKTGESRADIERSFDEACDGT